MNYRYVCCNLIFSPITPTPPSMKQTIKAALDIGTNSTLFLLAELNENGAVQPLHHEVRTNDLGRGTDGQGNLQPQTIALNLELLRSFRDYALAQGANEILIAGTEALRRAANADAFVELVKSVLHLNVRIISGEEEAFLTYRGVRSGLSEMNAEVLVVDVGGGSIEIIHGRGEEILHSISLPLGAVSLDRRFIHSDPPIAEEVESVHQTVREALPTFSLLGDQSQAELIVCGGTASALASAAQGLAEYQPEKIAGYKMTLQCLVEFETRLAKCALSERQAIPGIGRRRAEIILPGTVILIELLKALNRTSYLTSERGLRYGLLLSSDP
ncbi:MAG: Ppx/GppA phosphatase family protein [bacterium]